MIDLYKETFYYLFNVEDTLFQVSPFYHNIIEHFTSEKSYKNKCLKFIHEMKSRVTNCRNITHRPGGGGNDESDIIAAK